MRRGEVWWAELPEPVASEPGYRRPVLIVQSDHFNRSRIRTVIVVVLTTNLRLAEAPGNVPFSKEDTALPADSVANVSQIVTLDKTFLTEQVARVSDRIMMTVEDGIRTVLALQIIACSHCGASFGGHVATEMRRLFNGTIADEQGVLAACFARLHLGERQVVRSMTRSGLHVPAGERMLSYLREHLEGLEEETLADFLTKNREQYPVEPDLNPGGRLICVGDEQFEQIFRDGDSWTRFRLEFPESDGTLRFSRVGLDRDVTQAILYAGQQFDWNVGSGGFWLFSKPYGEWTEAGRVGNWLS